jgi:uncharacterized hydrophobic protein (TIGR00271 family)
MSDDKSGSGAAEQKPKSWLSARVEPFWVNPATIKGTVALVFGLAVLLLPWATLTVFRIGFGVALTVSGVSDLWFNRRGSGGVGRLAEGLLSLGVGLSLILFPKLSFETLVLLASGYVIFRGIAALASAWSHRSTSDWMAPLVRGVLFVFLGALILITPEGFLGGIMVATATASFILGGIMLGFGLQYRDTQDLVDIDRATVSGIIKKWADSRDIGETRRQAISDTLFFEQPDRTNKLVSWWVMLLLSVAIATFAVLQDSTAVVIGAMLIAPLMTPIMGTAAGIVYGWRGRTTSSLVMVAAGVGGAIALAYILANWVPALVPLGVNSQVVSRISPTLVDTLIAIAAGAAGAYATVDDRVSSSITGVAIAVALVPPLAVVGIMLEAGRLPDALGAFLLFSTNLVSIILAGSLVLYLTGFAPFRRFKENRDEVLVNMGVVALAGILILIPLALTARDIVTDSSRRGLAHAILDEWADDSSGLRVVSITIEEDRVDVFLTGHGEIPDIMVLEDRLSEKFGNPVLVVVEHAPTAVIRYSDEGGLIDDVEP